MVNVYPSERSNSKGGVSLSSKGGGAGKKGGGGKGSGPRRQDSLLGSIFGPAFNTQKNKNEEKQYSVKIEGTDIRVEE